ncbi:hypothetical protein MMC14_009984, partial [Varicellaria rhodocarpa]|nr:hypothetical protein [Varicellaria rhodocarpa]
GLLAEIHTCRSRSDISPGSLTSQLQSVQKELDLLKHSHKETEDQSVTLVSSSQTLKADLADRNAFCQSLALGLLESRAVAEQWLSGVWLHAGVITQPVIAFRVALPCSLFALAAKMPVCRTNTAWSLHCVQEKEAGVRAALREQAARADRAEAAAARAEALIHMLQEELVAEAHKAKEGAERQHLLSIEVNDLPSLLDLHQNFMCI